jgi:hypothetical protein
MAYRGDSGLKFWVSDFKFAVSEKELKTHECEHFTEVHGMPA